MATLALKEMGKLLWEGREKSLPTWQTFLENAKKNLVFHFGVERHASFPQKPVVNQVCTEQVWQYTSILDQKVNKESGSEFLKRQYLLLSTYFCIMQNSQESQNNMM